MKTVLTKEANYSLYNSENFNKELDCDVSYVVDKISELFIDYFNIITENIKLKHLNFLKFIIIRGLDTIIHVFNHLLFYTKNIDLTYFHCQKAFYFYVEFISQISDDEKTFLQLNSKDATTYVYKKTIYEINNDIKKTNEHISDYTKLKINIINSYIELYKSLLMHLITHDIHNTSYITPLTELYKKLNKLNDKSVVKQLNVIIDKIYYCTTDVNKFYDIINLIIKKMIKTPHILDNKIDKFISDEFKDKLNETPNNFILWFIS